MTGPMKKGVRGEIRIAADQHNTTAGWLASLKKWFATKQTGRRLSSTEERGLAAERAG
jgi:hypothetical protein